MAVTWTLTPLVDPDVGRAEIADVKGRRGFRAVLSAAGTYTTGGDALPAAQLNFKEARALRVLSRTADARRITDATTASNTTLVSATAQWSPLDVGKIVAGDATFASDTFIKTITAIAARSVTDGVLNATTTITSASATFVQNDVGAGVTGIGIPNGAYIASVTNSTTAILSVAANVSATGVSVTIALHYFPTLSTATTTTGSSETCVIGGASRSVADGVVVAGSRTVTSATLAFVAYDVGRKLVGSGIPGGAVITAINSATSAEISIPATIGATGVTLVILEARPHAAAAVGPVLVPGVPGKVRLFTWSTAAELAGASNVDGTAFIVEVVGF